MRAAKLGSLGGVFMGSLLHSGRLYADDSNPARDTLDVSVLSSPMRDSYFVKLGTFETKDVIMIHYDSRTRNAKWVVEQLPHHKAPIRADRRDYRFHADLNIDIPDFRTTNEDYFNSNLDRGHLAAAANWRQNPTLMKETFSLMNASPQVGEGFNRDYWARHLTAEFDEVTVVTGPVFAPTLTATGQWVYAHRTIGKFPRLITVPTHFFKVIIAQRKSPAFNATAVRGAAGDGVASSDHSAREMLDAVEDSAKVQSRALIPYPGNAGQNRALIGLERDQTMCVAAFMIPNKPVPAELPLISFGVPLSSLEALIGTRITVKGLTLEAREEADKAWDRVVRVQGKDKVQPLEYALVYGVQRQDHHVLPPQPSTPYPSPGSPSERNISQMDRPSVAPSLPHNGGQSQGCSLWHLCEIIPCVLPKPYNERMKSKS